MNRNAKKDASTDQGTNGLGPFLDLFWHPLRTLGAFWGPRTSKMTGFLDDLFLDHILHRFWAPLGGGPHAIHSPIAMFAKGRPFAKKSDFELILSSFWSQNEDQNPNSTPFRTPRSDSWCQFSRSENHSKKKSEKKTSRRAIRRTTRGRRGERGEKKLQELYSSVSHATSPDKQGAADLSASRSPPGQTSYSAECGPFFVLL